MGKFGKLIKTLRVKSEKTLREVAEEIGISVSNLSDIEQGRRKPFGPIVLEKFARFVGADRNELLQLAAREQKQIEIPATKGERVNALAFSLARAETSDFDDDVKEKMERLIEALERKKK